MLFSFLVISNLLPEFAEANFGNGYPDQNLEVTPPGLAKGKQTIRVKVTGEAKPRPKTVWTQTDTEIWVATRNEGDRVETLTHSSGDSAVPKEKAVRDKITTLNYIPASLQDINGNRFKREFVKSVGIDDISYVEAPSYNPVNAKPSFERGQLFAILETKTGYPNVFSDKYQYSVRADGAKKFQVEYYTPLLIDFSGYVTETKEIRFF